MTFCMNKAAFGLLYSWAFPMGIPHNARGPLAGEFQPLAACKNLDYPPGNLRFLQFAID